MITYPNAKINLGLHVLNKREDGFHNLESLFVPIPLKDALEITPHQNENKPFIYSAYGLAVDTELEKNLIYKAWLLVSKRYSIPPIHCAFYKNIPMGAGLGGGSADAVFCLLLLNKVFQLQIQQAELLEMAAQLGSDCPFFVLNQASFTSGRGEILEPYSINLSGYYLVLVKPDVHISTAMAFSGVQKRGLEAAGELKSILQLPIGEWKNKLVNDFEHSIFPQAPVIKKIKDELYQQGAIYASMSGSGSSVYALFEQEIDLRKLFSEHFYFATFL
ncbi:MAG: 4-(cytidine 5'-diphospho)-2-C-methyl-D-erythritol kinase [Bacteroidia bacterium]